MKPILYILLFSIISSCGPDKKKEKAVDSTQSKVATQIEETATSSSIDESFKSSTAEELFSGTSNNFPEFSLATLTSDSLELKINNQMAELIQAYDTLHYQKITSSYAWERPHCYQGQEGPCTMSVEKEEETKTWFFDRSNQLRGFSIKLEGTSTAAKSILCLFSNDSLIAISEDVFEGTDAGAFVDHLRMLASSCPRCGMEASTFEGALNGDVKYFSEKDLVTKQKEFNESMPELISILKAGRKKAKEDGDDFVFSINRTEKGKAEEKSKAITYPVEFRVNQNLYPNYISKQ